MILSKQGNPSGEIGNFEAKLGKARLEAIADEWVDE
jgi:hypothetical protein